MINLIYSIKTIMTRLKHIRLITGRVMNMFKSKGVKIVIFLILSVFSLYLINNYKGCFNRPYIWGLKSASIIVSRPGFFKPGDSRSLPFDLNSPEQYGILSDIIKELGIGKIVYITESDQEFIHPGGSGPAIQLCFRSGAVIDLKSSVTYTRENDGGSVICRSKIIEDQITLYVNYLQEPIRIIAPKTKKLMDDDLVNVISLILSEQKKNDTNI